MSSLWARLEPLLARVQKPARYIGCEDGAITPRARDPEGGVAARLPRHLRGRPAQPGAADPLRDPQRTRRRRRRADVRAVDRPRGAAARARRAAVLGRHPPRRRRVRPARLQPVGRARLHERARTWSTSPASRCAPPTVGRSTRSSSSAATAAFNPEPLADFVDAGRARRGRRGRRRDHRGRRAPGSARPDRADRDAVLRELAQVPGVYVPSMYEVAYDGPRLVAVTPRYADVPADRRQAHGRRPRRVAVPEAPARAAHRGRPRPPERRGLPRLHPRAAASARPG